jgi:formiminotetrahydrofolate cyclodeaminase
MHKNKEVEQTYVHLHRLTRKNIQGINDIIKVKKIPKKREEERQL